MLLTKHDKVNNFKAYFDNVTGSYMRTGVLENGVDTGIDPFMTDFPELLDIGVMGHCVHGKDGLCIKSGVQCYQNGLHTWQANMSMEDFRRIVDECKNRTFQFALGGRGDADQHENFEEMLKYCRSNGIVPNFTSSGLGFTEHIADICKKYCGAVAVSWYRQEHTYRAIELLLSRCVKTNIHYVLGDNSVDEAIERLESCDFPKGINAVIFLLHKPVGLGQESNILRIGDERLQRFMQLVESRKFPFKIGFDSCTVPALLNYTSKLDSNSFDTCEGGRWSAYITADMKMLPCSFDNQALKWAYDIKNDTIENAWNSVQFEDFRSHFRKSCSGCKDRYACYGGCPVFRNIVLCDRTEKQLYCG